MYRLVDKINNSIGQDANSKSLIGVLDIYGFESFKTNRYETIYAYVCMSIDTHINLYPHVLWM